MTTAVSVLLLGLGMAVAPATHAEEGDEWEFSAYADSETEACEAARQDMRDQNYAARGDGSCERCEAQHEAVYPHALSGEWFCAIWGVEQASNDTFLVLPSSDDETEAGDGGDADDDAGTSDGDDTAWRRD